MQQIKKQLYIKANVHTFYYFYNTFRHVNPCLDYAS